MNGWMTSFNRKKHQRRMNKYVRELNKNIANDDLWRGRFVIRQEGNPGFYIYEDKYEEFVENDFTHDIDGWYDGGAGYFFGITIKSADEGEIIEVPFKEYEHENFLEMLNLHHYFFPNAPIPPRHYVINQVY